MNNILEKYVFDTNNVFEEAFEFENNEVTEALANLINKLPAIKSNEWMEIFHQMSSNSVDGKFNNKEAYIVATSKIVNGYPSQNKYLFAQDKKDILFYKAGLWTVLCSTLLKEFLKTASNKIGIPEYIASSVIFINKLQKQFLQDVYFQKVTNQDIVFINLKTGTLVIGKSSIKLEKHHPKYFLQYKLDYTYSENEKKDDFLDALKNTILSIDVQQTFQQAISQVIVKNFRDDGKICLYGVNKNIIKDFIHILEEIISRGLIVPYFGNNKAGLKDLFINFEEIQKDRESLEKIIFITLGNFLEDSLPKNINTNKSAVLNWMIDGVKEIIKNMRIYIAKECEDFKNRFDSVKLFVNESNLINTLKHPKSIVITYANVLTQYELFCELHDEKPLGMGKFNKELKALSFESTRRESDNV